MEKPKIATWQEPKVADGFRDLLPEQMFARDAIIECVRGVCENYGFLPLQTPAVERKAIMEGTAGEAREELFRVHADGATGNLQLRFDHTVPLARLMAGNASHFPLPFRRYQVGPVWRAGDDHRHEHEFVMFDFDTVGSASEVADAEIIAAMCDILRALGVARFKVLYSSRALLKSIFESTNIPDAIQERVIDVFNTRDAHGFERMRTSLRSCSLSDAQLETMRGFLDSRAPARDEVIHRLRAQCPPAAEPAIDVIAKISSHLDALGYGDDVAGIDVTVARKHSYYTGPVFEATIPEATALGPVMFGGRYDALIERFLLRPTPATGASIHIDHFLKAVEHLHAIKARKSAASVLVANIEPSLLSDYLAMTWELRGAGIATQLYVGSEHVLSGQLRYAEAYEIPLVLLFGLENKENGSVTVKDRNRDRDDRGITIRREELAATVQRLLLPTS